VVSSGAPGLPWTGTRSFLLFLACLSPAGTGRPPATPRASLPCINWLPRQLWTPLHSPPLIQSWHQLSTPLPPCPTPQLHQPFFNPLHPTSAATPTPSALQPWHRQPPSHHAISCSLDTISPLRPPSALPTPNQPSPPHPPSSLRIPYHSSFPNLNKTPSNSIRQPPQIHLLPPPHKAGPTT